MSETLAAKISKFNADLWTSPTTELKRKIIKWKEGRRTSKNWNTCTQGRIKNNPPVVATGRIKKNPQWSDQPQGIPEGSKNRFELLEVQKNRVKFNEIVDVKIVDRRRGLAVFKKTTIGSCLNNLVKEAEERDRHFNKKRMARIRKNVEELEKCEKRLLSFLSSKRDQGVASCSVGKLPAPDVQCSQRSSADDDEESAVWPGSRSLADEFPPTAAVAEPAKIKPKTSGPVSGKSRRKLIDQSGGGSIKQKKSSGKNKNRGPGCKTNKIPPSRSVKMLLSNIRGFTSKMETLDNIVRENNIKIVILNETHLPANRPPVLRGFKTYSRARVGKRMGGVAVLVAKEFDNGAVKIESGDGDLEYLAVRMENFSPPLSVFAWYGQQEAQHKIETINDHIAEVISKAKMYADRGEDVVIAGDLNLKVGNKKSGLVGNDEAISKGGNILLEALEEAEIEICNSLHAGGPGRTHMDATSKTERVLDLVMSNSKDKFGWLGVDEKLDYTPYRVRTRKGKTPERVYTDHRSVMWEFVTKENKNVKKTGKLTNWRYGKPGGRDAFYRETDEAAFELGEVIRKERNINLVMEKIDEKLREIKDCVYGRTTVSKKKKAKIDDEQIWVKRVKMLTDHLEEVEGARVTDKIYKTKKKIDREEMFEEMEATVDKNTGKVLQTRDEIFKYVLDYNREVLAKEDAQGEWQEVEQAKIRDTRLLAEEDDEESLKPLNFEDYIAVVEKVVRVKKAVYNDFVFAGPKFKFTMFSLMQRIYVLEEIPDCFRETMLKPLFKGKGSRREVSNHRFLHLKGWAAKVFEKLLMKTVESKVRRATPPLQQGGQPGGSTTDHLVSTMTVIRMQSKKQKPSVLTLMDIQKCFDKCKLDDILYELAQAGVKGKQLRLIRAFNENTSISIQGDVDMKRRANIINSVGQGTNGAVDGSALMIARVLEQHFNGDDEKMKLGEVEIDPTGYVDDVANLRDSVQGAKAAGARMTAAIDELSLKAHPTKTVNIVCGGSKKNREAMKEKLASDPMKIQQFDVQTVQSDVYLGMKFDEGGCRESIDASIEARRAKALVKTKQAKILLKDLRIQSVGWLDAARTLYQQTILPCLTYSAIAWIQMTKKQRDKVEAVQRHCIYDLLELRKTATYSAVLLELGMTRINHFINQLKINYTAKLVANKSDRQVMQILREQQKQTPEEGLLREVQDLCGLYGLPDCTEEWVDPDLVRETVNYLGMEELWMEVRRSSKIPLHLEFGKGRKNYFSWAKTEAKLFFFMRVGELNFRTNRKHEAVAKYGGTQCLVGVCSGSDDQAHVESCFGYQTKPPSVWTEEGYSKYLFELHLERLRRWKSPLIDAQFGLQC